MKATKLIHQARQQTTIAKPARVTGFGFWSGRDTTLEFRPAPENTGIVFVRTDVSGSRRVPAAIQHRVPGPRRTSLVYDGCPVEMVEHVMAALAGLRIDNCEVHCNQAEMPGMDGSSLAFVETLLEAGVVAQDSERKVLEVTETIRVEEGEAWIEASPSLDGETSFTYQLDYPHAPVIGVQSFRFATSSANWDTTKFVAQTAPARTFVLLAEAEELKAKGLGERVTYQDLLVFGDEGPLDNTVKYANECARHKTLDMIGDFALAGTDLIGHFTAFRSGHRLNSQMVFALLQHAASQIPLGDSQQFSKSIRKSA